MTLTKIYNILNLDQHLKIKFKNFCLKFILFKIILSQYKCSIGHDWLSGFPFQNNATCDLQTPSLIERLQSKWIIKANFCKSLLFVYYLFFIKMFSEIATVFANSKIIGLFIDEMNTDHTETLFEWGWGPVLYWSGGKTSSQIVLLADTTGNNVSIDKALK